MIQIHEPTPSLAFVELLRRFSEIAPNAAPHGIAIREALNAIVEIERPLDGPMETASASRNERMCKYLEAEFKLYESGEDRVEEFARHAKFWNDVTDGDRVNSAYGRIVFFDRTLGESRLCECCTDRVEGERCKTCGNRHTVGRETPWEWAKRKLVGDRHTRQAVVQYMRPDHYRETKDFVCTMHQAFHIREARLHSTVVMRSNDLVRGFAYDAPWFMRCQIRMAREIGVEVGTYTHIAHSLHVYERDMKLVMEMLGL